MVDIVIASDAYLELVLVLEYSFEVLVLVLVLGVRKHARIQSDHTANILYSNIHVCSGRMRFLPPKQPRQGRSYEVDKILQWLHVNRFDSTIMRLQFDRKSTTLRPYGDLRCGRTAVLRQYINKWKKRPEETQILCAGCSK